MVSKVRNRSYDTSQGFPRIGKPRAKKSLLNRLLPGYDDRMQGKTIKRLWLSFQFETIPVFRIGPALFIFDLSRPAEFIEIPSDYARRDQLLDEGAAAFGVVAHPDDPDLDGFLAHVGNSDLRRAPGRRRP